MTIFKTILKKEVKIEKILKCVENFRKFLQILEKFQKNHKKFFHNILKN